MKYLTKNVWMLLCAASLILSACSKETVEEGEYDNWQTRNVAMTDQWAANSSYRKIKTFTKDPLKTTANSDYIYVEVLEEGSGIASPLYTDTCRLAYRGRLIPSKSYAEGYVFDQSYLGDFSWATAGTSDFLASAVVNGFCTALMNMHIGDHWRVHIPYQLGYGETAKSPIPAYSDLTFDIALFDFWHPGETRPDFKARKR